MHVCQQWLPESRAPETGKNAPPRNELWQEWPLISRETARNNERTVPSILITVGRISFMPGGDMWSPTGPRDPRAPRCEPGYGTITSPAASPENHGTTPPPQSAPGPALRPGAAHLEKASGRRLVCHLQWGGRGEEGTTAPRQTQCGPQQITLNGPGSMHVIRPSVISW